jgi:uncharacterized membrane protein YwzB
MEVKGALIVRLNQILPHFTVPNEDQKGFSYAYVMQPVLDITFTCGTNWRIQQQLVVQYQSFNQYFTSTQLSEKLIPILLKLMATVRNFFYWYLFPSRLCPLKRLLL